MRRLALTLLALLMCAASARADEGMWPLDMLPSARMRAAIGWAPDQAWLDRVRESSARLESGCSASVMSADGLVQTNHHCLLACLQSFSTAQSDPVREGFYARTRGEERQCPGLHVQVLKRVTDVTENIENAASGVQPAGFARARDAEIARLEAACNAEAQNRNCQVITLYQGGRYALYAYHRYSDARVVFAPERAAAHFGGDTDNFNFPRYGFDVAYLRLYENGRPARTPVFLRMRTTPLTDGEPTLISGHPGATERLLTASQLAFQRDQFLPWRLEMLSAWKTQLAAFSAQSPDHARMASEALFTTENSLKAFMGRRAALADPPNFALIERRDADFQARVSRNPELAQAVGPAWTEITAAMRAYRGFYLKYQFAEVRPGQGSELLRFARILVRGATERPQPNSDRLPDFTDSRIAATRGALLSSAPVDAPLEKEAISFWAAKMREDLPANDPLVRRVLGSETPLALAERITRGSRLYDRAVREQLWEGGAAAIAASNDPAIVFMRNFDADARALRTRYLQEVEGPVARAQERLARARFRLYGATEYPDATFTLRLSYGRISGWTETNGHTIVPFTRISGLYQRATGEAPYKLADTWARARSQLRSDVIFNAVTTNDIIGGNSGSPVLDRNGNVVGAAFDGNLHSLGGAYFYDGARNRTVIVTSAVIDEALRKVYNMPGLARELTGR
ncbi:MAG: S46 family peptidase [Caulobacterales bacterium]